MKKQSMAKMLALLLVLGMILVGCSPAADTGSGNQGTATQETPAATDTGADGAAEPAGEDNELPFVELHVYMPGGEQVDQDLVNERLSEITRAKFNADFIIHHVDWGAWGDRISLMLSAGEAVDMVFDASFLGFVQNAGRNSYLPLDDILQRYGQDIIANTLPVYLESPKVNGITYGVACNKDITQDMGFYLIEEYATAAGITNADLARVRYLEDMEPLFEKALEVLPTGVTPIWNTINNTPNYVWAIGGTAQGEAEGLRNQEEMYLFRDHFLVLNYETGKVTPVWEFPSFKAQAELLQSWVNKGFFNADVTTTQQHWAEAAGTFMTSLATVTPMHHAFTQNGLGGTPLLTQAGVVKPGVIMAEFCGIALPVNSPHPERCMMILNEFFVTSDLMNTFTYGVEGVHWEKVSDNVITRLPDQPNYSPGTFWMMGTWFIGPYNSIYTWDDQDPDTYRNLAIFNAEKFVVEALFGFTFDSEPVKNELAAYMDVISRLMAPIINGVVDPGPAIEQLAKEAAAAGIDRIIAEYEAQYIAHQNR